MERKCQVNLFLGIIAVIAIIIAIFALSKRRSVNSPTQTEYVENIRLLNDTIKALREDILRYKSEIERIDLEREVIREQLNRIIKDNEKTDTELANGDWDVNIRFLSDFLSQEDTLGERHGCLHNQAPAH